MTEDYVGFETAKIFKDRGFREEVLRYYSKSGLLCRGACYDDWNYKDSITFSAPTLQMAAKWLREKHGAYIQIEIEPCAVGNIVSFSYYVFMANDNNWMKNDISYYFYEEALEDGIIAALELIK